MVRKKKKFDWLWICFIGMTIVAIILVILLINNQFNIIGFVAKDIKEIHPFDRIDDSNIKVYSDKIVIEGSFNKIKSSGTGSMLPMLFKGATYFTVEPDKEEIEVGDVIVFKAPKEEMKENGFNISGTLITHRIIDKGTDSEGIYYYTKGDHNNKIDGAKIRFENITRIVVGVIW